jgi:hypothetical protein
MQTTEKCAEFFIRHRSEIVFCLRFVGADGLSGLERGTPQIGIEFVRASHVGGAPADQIGIGLWCIGETIAFKLEQQLGMD